MKIDITTGDEMTPKEIQISYPFPFDDRRVMVKAYTQETTLGEKHETDSAGIGRTNRSAGFMEKISDTKYICKRDCIPCYHGKRKRVYKENEFLDEIVYPPSSLVHPSLVCG